MFKKKRFSKKVDDSKTKVFGVDPEYVLQRPHENKKIPLVVDEMLNYLEKHVATQGIFRHAGNAQDMRNMMKKIDEGKAGGIGKVLNPHTIGSLLKYYIRTLPTSLCEYNDFVGIVSDNKEEMVDDIKKRLDKLTQVRRNLLYRLLHLLKMIDDNKETSKMDSSNLSLVWGMNILQPGTTDPIVLIGLAPKLRHENRYKLEREINELCSALVNNKVSSVKQRDKDLEEKDSLEREIYELQQRIAAEKKVKLEKELSEKKKRMPHVGRRGKKVPPTPKYLPPNEQIAKQFVPTKKSEQQSVPSIEDFLGIEEKVFENKVFTRSTPYGNTRAPIPNKKGRRRPPRRN